MLGLPEISALRNCRDRNSRLDVQPTWAN